MEKQFKIGDKVVIKGVIVEINNDLNYPINVNIGEYGKGFYFNHDGKYHHTDKEPTIFHENQERVVQVRQFENHKWENRVFFMEKNGKFLCWQYAETVEDSKKESATTSWNFMREIPEKRVITMHEIADKFNIEIDQIEIEEWFEHFKKK